MADFEPLVITHAEGCFLFTDDGRRLFDGVASLWCNIHGHQHPKINAAISDQLDRVAHVTTLGMSADITDRLAAKIACISPGDLSHVFFSSDGSSAVEAALKMAFQYWQQCEDAKPQKTKFLALSSAYHGDTTGAVSLGGIKFFHELFSPILFEPIRGPLPCSYRLPRDVDASLAADHYASEIERLLIEHHHTIAAIIMEPLVQGAAGLITHPAGLLSQVRSLCNQYDVLLICDEVATGFGRTGKWFACDHESVTPDILCLGKGITAGYLPMAATVARPIVFDAFLAESFQAKQFFHGHTFGGNPLAAAAALASIDLLEDSDTIETVEERRRYLLEKLSPLSKHKHVGDIRGRGLMFGIELVEDRMTKSVFPADQMIGQRVCQVATELGVWLRPLSDVVVIMPPLVATYEQLDQVSDVVIKAIQKVLP